jgi:hypothetical protein
MIDSQFFSMQSLVRKTSNTKLRMYDSGGKLRSFAIHWITDQWKSQVRQMNPQLMGSAGAGRESQESEPTQRIGGISESKTLFHPPLRNRLAFLAQRIETGHSLTIGAMASDRLVDNTLFRGDFAPHKREVLLMHSARLELASEMSQDSLILGDNHHSGSVFV